MGEGGERRAVFVGGDANKILCRYLPRVPSILAMEVWSHNGTFRVVAYLISASLVRMLVYLRGVLGERSREISER